MTNFLSLPLELRRKIYGYVVSGAWMDRHSPQYERDEGKSQNHPIMYTRPSIRDEFLQVMYGMVEITFQTVFDRQCTEDSSDSSENFGTFIQESRHRPFDQIKILEFTYSDESATGEDSSRNSQLVEALQHFADFGCHLRVFILRLGLAGSDNKFPDLDSWRTKLLGGTAIVDALCTLHVTKKIIILVSDSKLQNKGVELIAKMAEEVATRKRWYSSEDEWGQVFEGTHGCEWLLGTPNRIG